VISVDISGHRFQLRAAAVICHDGFILLHRLKGDEYWALPGGRVEPGEDAQGTVKREMVEELNEHVECMELLYVVENFFEHAGRKNHEIGLYFRTQVDAASKYLDKTRSYTGLEPGTPLEFRWFLMEQLRGLDLRPSFLRESLSAPTVGFQHVVQRR
jgi:ADP-ribose pyrophosphatase YjhB (NUDIX family)